MAKFTYVSPFSEHYTSPEMGLIFSKENRTKIFRTLWTELARAQKELGLSISKDQIRELEAKIEGTVFDRVRMLEEKFHDPVMAHLLAYGEQCPSAKSILHLGASSSFVTDNADLIQTKEALLLLRSKLIVFLHELYDFSSKYKDLPSLSYANREPTHPTTLGKRSSLWLADFLIDFQQIDLFISQMPFLGVKGAAGTQSSFLTLFDQDPKKVKKLDEKVAQALGFKHPISLSAETYSRKWDIELINRLASFAASSHKCASDVRLLGIRNELLEGIESSSPVEAATQRNREAPLPSETVCCLSRYLISLAQNRF